MSGDTLWAIAAQLLGDSNRWPEIYDANQTVIEAAAREHPRPPVFGSSDHGHWIFPGTRLTIPGASCAPATPSAPATPPTTSTTAGGVSDEEACKALGEFRPRMRAASSAADSSRFPRWNILSARENWIN
ncbi:LysM peptidoglycan-binding domain-containing protein [Kitasatospora arboriphila]